MRRLAKVATVVVVLFLALSLVGARVAVAGSRAALRTPPGSIGSTWSDVTFPSRGDAVALSGWLFTAVHPSGRSVILVHGWQGDREDVDFVPLARDLLARGYAVLMFDLRGSGTSAGTTQTFAHDEPRDVLGAHDFLLARGWSPALMTIIGNSMGAATVLEAAPELDDVGALVADSSFADLSSSMQGGLTRFTHLPGVLAVPAIELARLFDVQPDLRPVDVVRSLPHRAFLFIHARGDRLLPVADAQTLRAASTDPGTRLLVIDGADHLDTYTHDPATYLRTLLAFVDGQIATR